MSFSKKDIERARENNLNNVLKEIDLNKNDNKPQVSLGQKLVNINKRKR